MLSSDTIAFSGRSAPIERAIDSGVSALLQQGVDGTIRHLARSDPHAAVQRRVERRLEKGLVQTFRKMGKPAERASRLAGIGLAIAAGTQQLERRVKRRRVAGLVSEYRRWVDASTPRR